MRHRDAACAHRLTLRSTVCAERVASEHINALETFCDKVRTDARDEPCCGYVGSEGNGNRAGERKELFIHRKSAETMSRNP